VSCTRGRLLPTLLLVDGFGLNGEADHVVGTFLVRHHRQLDLEIYVVVDKVTVLRLKAQRDSPLKVIRSLLKQSCRHSVKTGVPCEVLLDQLAVVLDSFLEPDSLALLRLFYLSCTLEIGESGQFESVLDPLETLSWQTRAPIECIELHHEFVFQVECVVSLLALLGSTGGEKVHAD